jgi:signal peptidase II
MIFFILTLLVIILDQLSKGYISAHFQIGQSVPLLGNFFRITFIYNAGGVFGSKMGSSNFYTIVSIIAILAIGLIYFRTKEKKTALKFSLGLILGGAAGNLIDRFRFGQVADFLDVDFFNINIPSFKFLFFKFNGLYLDRWPIFNFADSAITVGLILLIYHFSFQDKKSRP